MPPTWRKTERQTYSYLVTKAESGCREYQNACYEANKLSVPNPRVFTPSMLNWASAFHPRFFHALTAAGADVLTPLKLGIPVSPGLEVATARYWLQSVIFLAGVTLSAAIIQGRFSRGTLESKLDRLWQVGATATAAGIDALEDLRLPEKVQQLAEDLDNPIELLLKLKRTYHDVLMVLSKSVAVEAEAIAEAQLDATLSDRFGFRSELAKELDRNVRCIIVYGSSVASSSFADYDLILVVEDRDRALRTLAKRSPKYRGVELNISVFEPEEFWAYQTISGDNLSLHGLCLYGEVLAPRKSKADLLARNFSFGFVRMRQLIGMTYAMLQLQTPDDDKANLQAYFAKIPLNVARGILGATGTAVTKEAVVRWAANTLSYSPDAGMTEGPAMSLAASAWATNQTLVHFNKEYCVCKTAS